METLRAACAGVFFLTLLTNAARADDAGSRADLRALRHDAPILLAETMLEEHLVGRLVIDDVVVSGNDAAMLWSVGEIHRIERFARRRGAWWIAGEIWIDPRTGAAMGGSPADSYGPTPSLLRTLGYPKTLIELAALHLPIVQVAQAKPKPPPTASNPFPGHFHGDWYVTDEIAFTSDPPSPWPTDGYGVTVRFAANDAPADARYARIEGRRPDWAPSRIGPIGDDYFELRGVVVSPKPIHITSGSTIDVWFPFVLDSDLEYDIALSTANQRVAVETGRLDQQTNVVHFELPAFTAIPGAALVAEVTALRL